MNYDDQTETNKVRLDLAEPGLEVRCAKFIAGTEYDCATFFSFRELARMKPAEVLNALNAHREIARLSFKRVGDKLAREEANKPTVIKVPTGQPEAPKSFREAVERSCFCATPEDGEGMFKGYCVHCGKPIE